jgi:hypothetical protein
VQRIRGTYGKIDLFWPGIVLVEHKSLGEDLGVATSQAFSYIRDLTGEGRSDEVPRFVIVSDFERFMVYDLEPEEQQDLPLWDQFRYSSTDFVLADLHRNVRHFAFLRGEKTLRLNPEDSANQKAYDLMCELHDELGGGGFTGEQLEKLLVRILFCLFAEDTGLFELIRVDVGQFYGIEIGAWPVEIARVALWLLDHQMNQRVSEAFGQYFQRLPLRSTPHILRANAVRQLTEPLLPARPRGRTTRRGAPRRRTSRRGRTARLPSAES